MLQLLSTQPNSKPQWLVAPVYMIGSASDCNIAISNSCLQGHHARLEVDGELARLVNLIGDQHIRVNGVPVKESRDLAIDDVLVFGTQEYRLLDSRRVQPAVNVSAAQTAEQEWELKPVGAALAGREFVLNAGVTIVGRARDCDITLGIAHLSRKHARLEVTSHGLLIQDLNSANGTYVNGMKIEKAMAHPGDTVRFDSIDFCVAGPHQDTDLTTVRPVLRTVGGKLNPGPVHAQSGAAAINKDGKLAHKADEQSPPSQQSSASLTGKNAGRQIDALAGASVAGGADLVQEKSHRVLMLATLGITGVVVAALAWFILH